MIRLETPDMFRLGSPDQAPFKEPLGDLQQFVLGIPWNRKVPTKRPLLYKESPIRILPKEGSCVGETRWEEWKATRSKA